MNAPDPQTLRELERLQVAFEGIGDGLWDWDVRGETIWLSAQVADMLGARDGTKSVSAEQIRARINPEDLATLQAALGSVVSGQQPRFAADVRLWHLDGHWLWMNMRGTVLAHDPDGTALRLVGTLRDISGRKAREHQQAVLLRLSDTLLSSPSAGSALNAALKLIGTAHGVSRVCFGDVDADLGTITVRHEWNDGTVPSVIGSWRMSDFGVEKEAQLRSGRTVAISDVALDPRTSSADTLAAYAPYAVCAILNLPMIRNGRFEAVLFLHHKHARTWTTDEIAFAENARSRIWDAVIRDQAEQRLRQSEERLSQIFRLTPTIPWVTDADGNPIMMGENWAKATGLRTAEAADDGWVEALHPDDRAEALAKVRSCRASGERMDLRYRMRGEGAGWRWFRLQGAPSRDPAGAIDRWYGYLSDIHEQVEAELALRASERTARDSALLLERILETSPDLIWVMDADGRYVMVNAATERVIGIDHGDVAGRTPEDLLDPEHARSVRAEFARILSGEELAVEEPVFDASLQEIRLFDSRKVPLRNLDQRITGVVGVARDITERKAVEVRLQAIVDTAVDAIVVIDETGCIASANPATSTLFGYGPDEMIGRNVAMIMPPEDSTAHDRYIDNYQRTGHRRIIGIGRQVHGQRKDGSSFPLDLSIAEWFDASGKRHYTGIMRDVTARLSAEARLRRAHDTLLSVSRLSAAGAMASTLAHELNQPLTAAANLLRSARRMVERGKETQDIPNLLQEAAAEVLRAGDIIRRMREYTVNGELDPAPHRLALLAEQALAGVLRRPESEGVEIEWSLDPQVDEVMADRIQIEQVIANLLRNAIEAMVDSPRRCISLETERDGDQAALHVHDSGPGIADDQMERLFQPFATTKSSGTGLGLAICRTIVEAHGGQIHASNRPGAGASFTILLPIAPNAHPHA